MVLATLKRATKTFARYVAFAIFGSFMAWPIAHMIIVNNTVMSSWRLFGWGMYATPNAEQSRLRVVIHPSATEPIDISDLHEAVTQLSGNPVEESLCINLFLKESGQSLRKLPKSGFCQNEAMENHLDYFLHLGNTNHLKEFVNEAIDHAHQTGAEAFAFYTHQRFSLIRGEAYIESEVYQIAGETITSLGSVRHGEARREGNF